MPYPTADVARNYLERGICYQSWMWRVLAWARSSSPRILKLLKKYPGTEDEYIAELAEIKRVAQADALSEEDMIAREFAGELCVFLIFLICFRGFV